MTPTPTPRVSGHKGCAMELPWWARVCRFASPTLTFSTFRWTTAAGRKHSYGHPRDIHQPFFERKSCMNSSMKQPTTQTIAMKGSLLEILGGHG